MGARHSAKTRRHYMYLTSHRQRLTSLHVSNVTSPTLDVVISVYCFQSLVVISRNYIMLFWINLDIEFVMCILMYAV